MPKRSLSTNPEAVRSRIRRLPKKVEGIINTFSQKEADEFIRIFQEGLSKNNFRLQALQPETIRRKRRRGFSKPKTRLVAAGTNEKNSLTNALRITRTKAGRNVIMRSAKHWDSKLTLKRLLLVHEFGAVIRKGGRNIRIPPRPAFLKAFKRFAIRKQRDEPVFKVKREIQEAINEAVRGYARQGDSRKKYSNTFHKK